MFQKKNTYIQELFSPIDGELVTPSMYTTQYSYKFEDKTLFTAISNSPNINHLKNDFAIWGQRKSIAGSDLPIHARYAIDKKPQKYISLQYNEQNEIIKGDTYTTSRWDWREIIYRMALDFYKFNENSDYLIKLEKFNPSFVNGKTGYEQYYSDIQGFWR